MHVGATNTHFLCKNTNNKDTEKIKMLLNHYFVAGLTSGQLNEIINITMAYFDCHFQTTIAKQDDAFYNKASRAMFDTLQRLKKDSNNRK